ncbi:NACHT domain-containing protein [Allokutzneria oryzae]|uniref:NACHT domain-containing protein n=1 Tax=Allokutzneria oryzae TaxID=1378989 RepID=A0ABV6A4L5_9PSEU
MRLLPRLFLGALVSAGVTTVLAIAVNVVTSESVPPPFDVVKPYAFPVMIALWLLTAVLMAAQESPRQRARRLEELLVEPEKLARTVTALRGRLERHLRLRVHEQRLFPDLPGMPQAWRSLDGSAGRTRLATGPSGTSEPREYVRTFEAVSSRRLVVCGPEGTGKTDWLHTFALGMVSGDRATEAVPVLLELSQWPRNWDFSRWVRHSLAKLVPELGSRERGAAADGDPVIALLRSNRFVLLLDGLDEVAPRRRAELLATLNEELWLGMPAVMTSRTEVYLETTSPLRDAAVLVLEPLPPDGVEAWLRKVFPANGFSRWQPVVRALRRPGTPVAEALSTPLMVTLAAKVFQANDPGELTTLPDRNSITRRLLGGFVPVAYGRGGNRWPLRKARAWLEFLATRITRDEPRGIAWWRLYSFVPRWQFAVLLGAFVGLCAGVAAAHTVGLAVGPVPLEPVAYHFGDFFTSPWLALQSALENTVRSLGGGATPSAVVSAVVIGSVIGAATAAWNSVSLLSYQDSLWWQRMSWVFSPAPASRRVRAVVRDAAFRVACGLVAGSAVGAVSAAVTGMSVVFGDGTSEVFLLAMEVGAVSGAAMGVIASLWRTPLGRWGHPAPDAPTTVNLREHLPRPTRIVVTAGVGFAVGAGIALLAGRHPTLFGAAGAAMALTLLLLVAADDITESGAATSATSWSADRADASRIVLRGDIVASVIRAGAAMVLALPVLLSVGTVDYSRSLVITVMCGVLFVAIREVCVRPWSWCLVATTALAVRRRLPWRVVAFVEDARERQVLRREGGAYQFRSAALRDQLANAQEEPQQAEPEVVASQTNHWRRTLNARRENARRHRRWRAFIALNRVLLAQSTHLGQADLDTIRTQSAIAALMNTRRTLWLSEWYLEAAVSALPKDILDKDPFVVDLRLRWAAVAERRNSDLVAVVACLTKVRSALPDDDPKTASVTTRLLQARCAAIVRFHSHDPEEELAALLGEAVSETGADTATAQHIRWHLAVALGRAGRWAEAEAHFTTVAEWSENHLGASDDFTVNARKQLRNARRHRQY